MKKVKLAGVAKWESGVYRVVLKSKDKWGNEIKNTSEIVIYSGNDSKMPYTATSFFAADKYYAQPGEKVNVYLGSSYKDVQILYTLELKGKTVKTELIKLDSELKKIEISVDESFRGGATANFMFIKNGRIYTFNQRIEVGWNNKQLDLKFITFRDKTLPGSAENWKVKIKDNNSNPAQAEMMATLYDASLDVFAANSWYWSVFPYYYSYNNWLQTSFSMNGSQLIYQNYFKPSEYKARYTPSFDFFGFSYYGRYYYAELEEGDGRVMRKDLPNRPSAASTGMVMDQVMLAGNAGVAEQTIALDGEFASADPLPWADKSAETSERQSNTRNGQSPEVQVRKNFNETAFFYPNLVTDANGEVLISFTVPESLTRWNFLGFAHTKDLQMGTINDQMVTQNELMVMPNLPRYFRENDKITISTKSIMFLMQIFREQQRSNSLILLHLSHSMLNSLVKNPIQPK